MQTQQIHIPPTNRLLNRMQEELLLEYLHLGLRALGKLNFRWGLSPIKLGVRLVFALIDSRNTLQILSTRTMRPQDVQYSQKQKRVL
jgi:hypothetical protein